MVRAAVLLAVALCFALAARAQTSTNVGTEFWTAYMDHNNLAPARTVPAVMVAA